MLLDQTKNNEMGRECSNICERGGVHTGFWWGNLREGDHLKGPGVDGRTILKWIFEKWNEGHELDQSGSG